jgi:hypothetical protein
MAGGELGCDLRQQCASWPGSARDDRRAGRACAAQALTGLPIDRKFGIIRCVVTEKLKVAKAHLATDCIAISLINRAISVSFGNF